MREILENYKKTKEDFQNKKKVLEEEFEALLAKSVAIQKEMDKKLERAKARTDKAYKKITKLCEDKCPSIYRDIITPLAKKLSEHFGMPYEIYGPFGTECETSIYLRKDMNKSICDQPTISLTLRPSWDENKLNYNTGKKIMKYQKGSLGDLNGLNDVYAPLPMEFEEILKLVTYEDREEEIQEGGVTI